MARLRHHAGADQAKVFRVEAVGLMHPNEGGGAKALYVGAVTLERSKHCEAASESWRSAPGPTRRGARL
jgi:hypothetical protein